MKRKRTHGGKRENAGRPMFGEEKRVIVTLRLSREALEKLEKNRGSMSRGLYIESIMRGEHEKS